MKHDESIPWNESDQSSDPKRLADDLLVDAMLQGRYQDTPKTTAERVERACHALEGSPRLIPFRWKAGLSTAAAAVIILALVLTLSSPQSVRADLGPILEAFDEGDKTYRIDIITDANESRPPRRFERLRTGHRPPFRPPRRGMTARRLDDATLSIRGRSYILICRAPRGGQITKGFDGTESWLITPWGGSRRSDDPNLLRTEIPDHISSLLFLNLRDTLQQIEEHYILSGSSAGTLADGQTPTEYYLAERIARRGGMPRRIELWVDPITHELQQITCTSVAFRSPRETRYTLQITLVDTTPLPEDWFTQQAHLKVSTHRRN